MNKKQARQKIENFIKRRGYTWNTETLLEVYLNYYKQGWYVSYTAKDCIKHLENELETLSKYLS